ncbi:MAG: CPBP family intramembrane glutamic endopeptidase [Bacteroidales bacterium]
MANKITPEKRLHPEIVAVLITGLLKFPMMDWLNYRAFYIIGVVLFWTYFIYRSYKNDPKALERWGIQKKNFRISMRALLPFALIAIPVVLIYGWQNNTVSYNWHLLPILILYPVWGTFQQFIVASLVAGNLKYSSGAQLNDSAIILFVAALFALMHSSDWVLVAYVFVMEIFFLWVYLRWRNLWALGIYHGIVSALFLFYVSGRDLFQELFTIFNA